MEEGRSRSRENNQETNAVIQMSLDGGISHVGRVGTDMGEELQVIASSLYDRLAGKLRVRE